MITNLFSVFDPRSSIISLQLNWLSTILGISLIPYIYWLSPTRFTILFNRITKTLNREFKLLSNTRSLSSLILPLLFLIITNNTIGLIPYVFTRTSHMAMTLALALPLWLSFIIFGWINNINHIFTHLVPQGTPGPLIIFIVLIETISNVIRPGTLAIRLAANIIAGHLLLTLLGNQGPNITLTLISGLIIAQILLLILESAVALIQSYVFIVLRVLYSSEVYYVKNKSPLSHS